MSSQPILPGATIGFLGGGQLGRMTAFAARSMGYDVHVLDPDPACAMAPVSSRVITAPFTDVDAARDLASRCAVVTLEIEQIHPDVLDAVSELAPLRPSRHAVYIIQDRLRQKTWLRDQRFPVGPFHGAHSAEDVAHAVDEFGASIAKSCHGGYDGRGQVRLSGSNEAPGAWQALGERECLVEQVVNIAYEISVLVARNPRGDVVVYPPSRNHHTRGILTWAAIPAAVPPTIVDEAATLARDIATRLDLYGLLAVECFVTAEGRLLVNELAPRPHNTYHHSERACSTGQFEQLVRAVCNLPLGDARVVEPGAIVNLLGDVWMRERAPDFDAALAVSSLRLHLYGKAGARPGRKMGHLSALGSTSQEALNRVLLAYRAMSPGTSSDFDVHEPDLFEAVRPTLTNS